MKVLMVASGKAQIESGISPFIYQQILALRAKGVEVDIFSIKNKGLFGYAIAIIKLNILLFKKKYELIHGHYIYAALVTIIQYKIPVVSTLIGTDIYNKRTRLLSKLTILKRAKAIIFVSEKLQKLSGYNRISYIIQYGLNLDKFNPDTFAEL